MTLDDILNLRIELDNYRDEKLASTTQDATQIGSQRGPSSVSKIQAETKQLREELDLAGEQRGDDQVVAGKKRKLPWDSKGWHPNDTGYG